MTETPPIDDAGLFRRLDALYIAHETHTHPPLRTVAESQALRGELPGQHIKNLFLRDKKRNFFLVTLGEEREVDLKALRRHIGAKGTLSFGSAEALSDMLGVEPGAVTPFGVVNDPGGQVTMVLDTALTEGAPVNAHPLRNDMTTTIAAGDLVRFLEAEGHTPALLDFDTMD